MAGIRVVKGLALLYATGYDDDIDCVGTARNSSGFGCITVNWDNGIERQYMRDHSGQYDLCVLDNAPLGVKHDNYCNACPSGMIRGIRWKCNRCDSYDLCTSCYGQGIHTDLHEFCRIDRKHAEPIEVGKREGILKLPCRGIFTGTTVVRDEKWNSSNEGTMDDVGYVVDVMQKYDFFKVKSTVNIQWANGTQRSYTLGQMGIEGVQAIDLSQSSGYFPEHLPVLKDIKEFAPIEEDGYNLPGGEEMQERLKLVGFSVGELVRLNSDRDKVIRIQSNLPAFDIGMIEKCGKIGTVRAVTQEGYLVVEYDKTYYQLDPILLTSVLNEEIKYETIRLTRRASALRGQTNFYALETPS